jgi:Cu-Zn family superoxide dismutase
MSRSASIFLGLASLCLGAAQAEAASVKTTLLLATPQGAGASVGEVTITDGPGGAVLAYDLKGLPAGRHGFHVHANASCAPAPGKDGQMMAAGAAGGHFDPAASGKHLGPEGEGHLGDLPLIEVGADGSAHGQAIAPHIHDAGALKDHALMLHAGGDTYTDTPAPLGGGGPRLACGVLN